MGDEVSPEPVVFLTFGDPGFDRAAFGADLDYCLGIGGEVPVPVGVTVETGLDAITISSPLVLSLVWSRRLRPLRWSPPSVGRAGRAR